MTISPVTKEQVIEALKTIALYKPQDGELNHGFILVVDTSLVLNKVMSEEFTNDQTESVVYINNGTKEMSLGLTNELNNLFGPELLAAKLTGLYHTNSVNIDFKTIKQMVQT